MKIELDCQPLSKMIAIDPLLERRASIQAQKQALSIYRNQRLSHVLGQQIDASDIVKTVYGKPYLAAYEVAFNHSHSQQHYALVISSDCRDIGVDVEDLTRKVNFSALARHAFTAQEQARWQMSHQDSYYWFQVWTAKEAILKASGLGIRLSLNTLETQTNIQQMSGVCEHERLGRFAYQHIQCHAALVTVAWRVSDIVIWPNILLK